MLNRTVKVDYISVNSIGSSSAFQIGDSKIIQSVTRALAVQREQELFFGNEGNLDAYPIFHRPIPNIPIHENLFMQTTSLHPIIKIGTIDILATSSSAIIHLGNSDHIQAESRIKHIRHLESDKRKDD